MPFGWGSNGGGSAALAIPPPDGVYHPRRDQQQQQQPRRGNEQQGRGNAPGGRGQQAGAQQPARREPTKVLDTGNVAITYHGVIPDYIKLIKQIHVKPLVRGPPEGEGPRGCLDTRSQLGDARRCRSAPLLVTCPRPHTRPRTPLAPPPPRSRQVFTATGAISPRTRKRFINFSLRETLFGGAFICHVSRKSLEYRNNLPLPIGGMGTVVLAAEWRLGQPIHKPRLMVALGGDAGAAVMRPGAISWRKAYFPNITNNQIGRRLGIEVRRRPLGAGTLWGEGCGPMGLRAHGAAAPACCSSRAGGQCACSIASTKTGRCAHRR
jgi:hypothetical protein